MKLNNFYDAYKEDYMSMYGTETNNYLWLDSDLELHIEQENPHHIFVSLFALGKKVWLERIDYHRGLLSIMIECFIITYDLRRLHYRIEMIKRLRRLS